MQVAQKTEAIQAITSLSKINFADLHDQALLASHNIKQNYLRMFDVLIEVEKQRIYEQFEVPSLYLYCVELLELSPQITKDFICVVRKSLEIPELASAIRSQRITISKARKICPALEANDFKQWIDLAETCSCRVVEKAVAAANPKAAIHESMRYLSEDVIEFKVAVSEEWTELLKRTKDLLSQQHNRAVSSEEALFILMSEHCEKRDPVAKAKRAESRAKASKINLLEPSERAQHGSRHIPAAVAHLVTLRDRGQCTHIDLAGKPCESKRWLHVHHKIAFASGGGHQVENLETLCAAHHKIRHMKTQS